MSKWTKDEILNRIRFGGEDPAELGRHGAAVTHQKRQSKKSVYRRMAERHSAVAIQAQWYNKED